MTQTAEWQLVLTLWGTKYGAPEVSQLIDTVRQTSSRPFRVVLISDRPREGLPQDVVLRQFPPFFLQPAFLTCGCQAKLAMFESGVVPTDLPAIYVDLDTVVFGDLSALLDVVRSPKDVMLFQSAIIPIGALGRLIARATRRRWYGRGNSSIVVFHPRETAFIAQEFRRLFDAQSALSLRAMQADERFISWCAQKRLVAVPKTMAVKFPTQFMLPWRWLIYTRASLPRTQERWNRLLAVTLPGLEIKGQVLLELEDGAEIVDRKGRILIWSKRALGPMKDKLTAYYRALEAREKETSE